MLLDIGIGIAEINLAGATHIGEGIQHVGELIDCQLLGLEISAVDSLGKSDVLFLMVSELTQFTKYATERYPAPARVASPRAWLGITAACASQVTLKRSGRESFMFKDRGLSQGG